MAAAVEGGPVPLGACGEALEVDQVQRGVGALAGLEIRLELGLAQVRRQRFRSVGGPGIDQGVGDLAAVGDVTFEIDDRLAVGRDVHPILEPVLGPRIAASTRPIAGSGTVPEPGRHNASTAAGSAKFGCGFHGVRGQ